MLFYPEQIIQKKEDLQKNIKTCKSVLYYFCSDFILALRAAATLSKNFA